MHGPNAGACTASTSEPCSKAGCGPQGTAKVKHSDWHAEVTSARAGQQGLGPSSLHSNCQTCPESHTTSPCMLHAVVSSHLTCRQERGQHCLPATAHRPPQPFTVQPWWQQALFLTESSRPPITCTKQGLGRHCPLSAPRPRTPPQGCSSALLHPLGFSKLPCSLLLFDKSRWKTKLPWEQT